jgi:hypothetical protein
LFRQKPLKRPITEFNRRPGATVGDRTSRAPLRQAPIAPSPPPVQGSRGFSLPDPQGTVARVSHSSAVTTDRYNCSGWVSFGKTAPPTPARSCFLSQSAHRAAASHSAVVRGKHKRKIEAPRVSRLGAPELFAHFRQTDRAAGHLGCPSSDNLRLIRRFAEWRLWLIGG